MLHCIIFVAVLCTCCTIEGASQQTVSVSPNKIVAKPGDNITFTCDIHLRENPDDVRSVTLRWVKFSQTFYTISEKVVDVQNLLPKDTLTLTNVADHDSAYYYCELIIEHKQAKTNPHYQSNLGDLILKRKCPVNCL